MNSAEARLDYGVKIDCPRCGLTTDLINDDCGADDENEISTPIFTNKWDAINGFEVSCHHCDHEFSISKLVY